MSSHKTRITFILFLILALVLIMGFVIKFKEQTPSPAVPITPPVENTEWISYANKKYNVEFEYPDTWQVEIDEAIPGIHIYKKGTAKPPYLTHHNNFTHISLYPDGIGTEGVQGEMASTTVQFKEAVQAFDYKLADGKTWATFAGFTKPPQSWQRWGFVFARTEIKDEKVMCKANGTTTEGNCELGIEFIGSTAIRSGTINDDDRNIEERILESIVFTSTVSPASNTQKKVELVYPI